MFAAIAGVGALANRLGQSVIPFYIVAGMVLGEFVLGRVALPVVGTTYIPSRSSSRSARNSGSSFSSFSSDWSSTSIGCSRGDARSGRRGRSTSRTSAPGSFSGGSSSAPSCRRF